MKKIDFRHFKMFTDIAHEGFKELDIHKDFADMLYKAGNGLADLELAMRIFKADGPMELSQEDQKIIGAFVNASTTPAFIDSYNENLHD